MLGSVVSMTHETHLRYVGGASPATVIGTTERRGCDGLLGKDSLALSRCHQSQLSSWRLEVRNRFSGRSKTRPQHLPPFGATDAVSPEFTVEARWHSVDPYDPGAHGTHVRIKTDSAEPVRADFLVGSEVCRHSWVTL